MAYRLAPHQDGMEIGQGFNSFTQEIQTANAVMKITERLTGFFGFSPEPSPFGVSTPTSSHFEPLGGAVEDGKFEVVTATTVCHERKPPSVSHTSLFVETLSDVTTNLGISGAVPVLQDGNPGLNHGIPFDVRRFHDANLNYYVGVKVVTAEIRPENTTWHPPKANGNLGDAFVSGFLEGGQLHVLLNIQVACKDRHADVTAAVETALSVHDRSFGSQEDIEALQTLKEHARITIQLNNTGGGAVTSDDQQWNIELLRDVIDKFPKRAAAQPSRTHAILTQYGTLGGFDDARDGFLSYDRTFLYTNTLLDAFMDFKTIDRRLSAQMAGIKARTMQFNTRDANSQSADRFDSTLSGLAKAKQECKTQMMKIDNEVHEVNRNPDIATDTTRNIFQDPHEFRDSLPPVEQATPGNTKRSDFTTVDVFHGDKDKLFSSEKEKMQTLLAERPNLGQHLRAAIPCGSDDLGEVFCSLDYLKPDWVLASVSLRVAGGIVCNLCLRYTNGLVTEFGPHSITGGGRLFHLDLNHADGEVVVGCSVEVGRVASGDYDQVRVTAVRLSTNRASSLVGQSEDWKQPVGGEGVRGGLRFKELEMTHFDAFMERGHVVGFWGRSLAKPCRDRGLRRIAPVWSDFRAPCGPGPDVSAAVAEWELDGEMTSGVWTTYDIHDWESPVPRTEAVIEYENPTPERPIPNIIAGVRKMDSWHEASLRFTTNMDFVTTKNFHIGVDQWSDSIFYGGEFSWVALPSNSPNIQSGKLDCHGSSVHRTIRFARPFSARPSVVAWISGLDLRIGAGRRMHVATHSIGKEGFAINVTGPEHALAWSTISWIAVTDQSGCVTGSVSCTLDEKTTQGNCIFPRKFAKPPKVLLAFSSFDISGNEANPRFGTHEMGVTNTDFDWKVYSWDDSLIKSATVQWIALPAY